MHDEGRREKATILEDILVHQYCSTLLVGGVQYLPGGCGVPWLAGCAYSCFRICRYVVRGLVYPRPACGTTVVLLAEHAAQILGGKFRNCYKYSLI